MADFKFIQNPLTKRWIISAPKRAKRPDEAKTPDEICPFCPEQLINETELYKLGEVVVVANKFPFAPIHEVIVHSSDHHQNFGELELQKTEDIFKTYRQRYQTHKEKGKVYIFHNRGEVAGESLLHPHSQLVVIPEDVRLEIQPLQQIDQNILEVIQTNNFNIFCPETSEWPDEVWISPKIENKVFGEISDEEISDVSKTIAKLVKCFSLRHGNEFPYNFYIYPGNNWYLRFMPRVRVLGGFEIGTNVFVNTQNPKETIGFLRENF